MVNLKFGEILIYIIAINNIFSTSKLCIDSVLAFSLTSVKTMHVPSETPLFNNLRRE